MPFGKNRKLTTRAKKTKVIAVNEEVEEVREVKDDTGFTSAGVMPPAPEREPAQSPGAAKREQAKEESIELLMDYEIWEEEDAKEVKALSLSRRIYDARMARIDKAQAGKRHGNPALEIERIYKAELELTQAKFKRSEVESSKHAASANWHAQESHVLRLENAKLRRMLRAHGHDRLCV